MLKHEHSIMNNILKTDKWGNDSFFWGWNGNMKPQMISPRWFLGQPQGSKSIYLGGNIRGNYETGKSAKTACAPWESYGYPVGGRCWFCSEESWKKWVPLFMRKGSTENEFNRGTKE